MKALPTSAPISSGENGPKPISDQLAQAPQGRADGPTFLLEADQVKAFRTDEGAAHERPDILRRERPQADLGSARPGAAGPGGWANLSSRGRSGKGFPHR